VIDTEDCQLAQEIDMSEKRYPNFIEESCTHFVDGRLQITPDIEEEIAEVDRGETVSMSEFKIMFAKWLD
jgi:predicted transcriptional regulator